MYQVATFLPIRNYGYEFAGYVHAKVPAETIDPDADPVKLREGGIFPAPNDDGYLVGQFNVRELDTILGQMRHQTPPNSRLAACILSLN